MDSRNQADPPQPPRNCRGARGRRGNMWLKRNVERDPSPDADWPSASTMASDRFKCQTPIGRTDSAAASTVALLSALKNGTSAAGTAIGHVLRLGVTSEPSPTGVAPTSSAFTWTVPEAAAGHGDNTISNDTSSIPPSGYRYKQQD